VESDVIRPAATLTSRLGSVALPKDTPRVAVLPAKSGVTPPTAKELLAPIAKLAISVAPKVAPVPMATLSAPVVVAFVPMAMPPSEVATAPEPSEMV
jgi:hypothetical protein